ncbi:hypothetical protein RZN25_14855 [Bacillaceae bacterium S4-13-56]
MNLRSMTSMMKMMNMGKRRRRGRGMMYTLLSVGSIGAMVYGLFRRNDKSMNMMKPIQNMLQNQKMTPASVEFSEEISPERNR